MKIGVKLIGGFAIVAIIGVLASSLLLYNSNRMVDEISANANESTPELIFFGDVEALVHQMTIEGLSQKSSLEKIKQLYQQLGEKIKISETQEANDDEDEDIEAQKSEQAYLQRLKRDIKVLYQHCQLLWQIRKQASNSEKFIRQETQLKAISTQLYTSLYERRQKEFTEFNARVKDANQTINTLIRQFISVIIMSFLITVGLGVLLRRNIVRPIQQLQSASVDITIGKYDTQLKVSSRDEIGGLTLIFNQMARTLGKISDENHQLIEKIQQSNLNLTALMRSTSDSIHSINNQYQLTTFNDAFQQYYQNLGGTLSHPASVLDLINNSQHTIYKKAHYQKALSGQKHTIVESMVINEYSFFYEITYNPITTNDFQVNGVSVFCKDITTQENYKRNLQQINQELKASQEELIQNQHELLTTNDELHASKQRLEVILDTIQENEEKLQQLLAHSKAQNELLKNKEVQLQNKVTELKTAQTKTLEAQAQAQKANEAKTQFLANMSHEIRSPLNAISGFSQILLDKERQLQVPAEFYQFLQNINQSSQNLSELINNILDLSKIEAGKVEVFYETLNLKQLFQGLYHINQENALKKGVRFSYSFDANLPEYVATDRTKVNQILMNLISNAIKFTPIRQQVIMKAEKERQWLVFKVTDEGMGIPIEKQQHIFGAFEQSDNTITRRFGGTGLGLAITKKMVKMMEGHMTLESEEGVGSVFTVKLPLKEVKQQKNTNRQTLENYKFSKDNIVLIAEDNLLNQRVLQVFFKNLPIQVHVVENGKLAVEKTKELHPDLILMDLHMPEMSGLEATKVIRQIKEFADLPIVAISADAFIQQQQNALEAGMNDYLTKPIDLRKLKDILVEYLKPEEYSEESSDDEYDVLPSTIQAQVNQAINELVVIPVFKLGDLLEQIKKIRNLVQIYQTPYTHLLQELEDAVFEDDPQEIKAVLEKILNV